MTRDVLLRTKKRFISDQIHLATITKKNYYNIFENVVLNYELSYDKDLCNFTYDEYKSMFESLVARTKASKKITFYLTREYVKWAKKKGLTTNDFKMEYKKDFLKVNKMYSNSQYLTVDRLYEAINDMLEQIDINFVMPLILARIGICGKGMIDIREAKFSDINFINSTITIGDRILSIDSRFLKLILQNKDTYYGLYRDELTEYKNNEYIFKSFRHEINSQMDVYNAIRKACEVIDIEPINLKNLQFSMIFDLYDNMLKVEGRLTTSRTKEIYNYVMGTNSTSGYVSCNEKYTQLTSVKIHKY